MKILRKRKKLLSSRNPLMRGMALEQLLNFHRLDNNIIGLRSSSFIPGNALPLRAIAAYSLKTVRYPIENPLEAAHTAACKPAER